MRPVAELTNFHQSIDMIGFDMEVEAADFALRWFCLALTS
jgi:hypothetical protein